jgi:hypothetical protein
MKCHMHFYLFVRISQLHVDAPPSRARLNDRQVHTYEHHEQGYEPHEPRMQAFMVKTRLSIKTRPSYELNRSQDTRDSIPIPQTSHYEHTGRLRTSSQNFVFSARLVDDLVCVSRVVWTGITWSGTLRTSPLTFRISEQPGRISSRDPDITFTDLRRFIPFLIWR